MRKLLLPLMRTEDPVLWGLIAVVALYAIAGASMAWARGRAQTRAPTNQTDD